jgi:hypothetical protein
MKFSQVLIELLAADMGIIRNLDPARGVLKIEAHRGFKQEFLASFREVSAGVTHQLGGRCEQAS